MPLLFNLISELAHFCIEYMYELHDFYWEVRLLLGGIIIHTYTMCVYLCIGSRVFMCRPHTDLPLTHIQSLPPSHTHLQDFTQVSLVFTKHINAFWMLFLVDLRETMKVEDNILQKLRLFHTVNQYFCSQRKRIFMLNF